MENDCIKAYEFTREEKKYIIERAKESFIKNNSKIFLLQKNRILYGMCAFLTTAIEKTIENKYEDIINIWNYEIIDYIPEFTQKNLGVVNVPEEGFWWNYFITHEEFESKNNNPLEVYAIKVRVEAFDKLLSYYK